MGGIIESIYGGVVVVMLVAMWFVVAMLMVFCLGAVINDLILLRRGQREVVLKLLRDALPIAVLATVFWILGSARDSVEPLGWLFGAILVLIAWGFGPGKEWTVKHASRGE